MRNLVRADFVFVVTEVATVTDLANGFPVAEFDVTVVEAEIDAAVMRD